MIGKTNCGGGNRVKSMTVTFTGTYLDTYETMSDGKLYRLLTITSGGVLTISEKLKADYWYCNGGANGISNVSTQSSSNNPGGKGGAFRYGSATIKNNLQISVAIGAGGDGITSITQDAFENHTYTDADGSGGGQGGNNSLTSNMAGGGVSTKPFFDNFFDPHCAGGGGGGAYKKNSGGNGGSDGSNGGNQSNVNNTGYASNYSGGDGGEKGGGSGGASRNPMNGTNGTFYGAGGGGGGAAYGATGTGGAGYQGVLYIRFLVYQ